MKGTQGFGREANRAAILITAAITLTLSACSSGGGDYDSAWVGDIEKDVNVSGSVGDGPAANASVTIRKKGGEVLTSFKSDANGSYDIDLSVSERHFPLHIDATGGTDIVTNAAPDFVLRSAVLSPRDHVTANVNPFSTVAYELAKDLNGGLTRENLLAAENIVASSMNNGLTTLVNSGPMRSPVNGTNVAEIIKASETLAETVRRTRDALNSAGRSANANVVVEALGSDLIDEVIEGNGGPRADARAAAVTVITTAQVLLESMSNELHVNGVDATNDIRRAIEQLFPAAGPTLDELGATSEMLYQAGIGLEAAFEITGDTRIYDLLQSLAGMQPGMNPSLIQPLLPSDYRTALNAAIAMTASGDMSVVTAVNQVARTGGSQGIDQNRPPAISGQPPTSVQAGTSYSFVPVASDLDNDPLTFSITGRPEWANFDTATGSLSGTPQAGDARTYEGITITVSDGELTRSIGPFSITVTVNNTAPTISGTPPATIGVGESYTFEPTVSDRDSNVFQYSILGKPSWADFDILTGRLTGTPSSADVGLYRDIEISVTDGTSSASLPPFSITVTENNTAPTITGTPPATIGVGESYAFEPTVSDRDSNVFRYSILGKPSWADFDVLTGRLTGTPSSADVGLYRDIEISVTDGTSSASLPPFSIEVVATGAVTGSVTLDWTPPTENEDGTQLMDLAGYRLYWSRDGGAHGVPVNIDNPSVTRYVVDNLTPGTYEFVATSLNDAGVESRFSNAVTKIVQ